VPNHYSRKKVYGLGPQLEADYANQSSGAASAPIWKLEKLRIYVPGPEGIAGTMEFNPGAPFDRAESALVYHYDHLGSIERITPYGSVNTAYVLDGAGKPSRYSYDAWGQRRNADTWSGKPTATADGGSDDATPRGFTGHEMLDDLGLVHMNGRIYDPLLGRFLSADTVVQYPGDLQNYNRYSYVNNNPLTYRDPSGHIIETLRDVANVAMGVKPLIGNIREGNVGSAILDGVGIVADTAAAIVPCIPGGAGTAIKVARGTAAVASKIEKIGNMANAAEPVVSDVASGDINLGTLTSTAQVALGAKAEVPKVSKADASNLKQLDGGDVKTVKGGGEAGKLDSTTVA
jgi:RHS repeat-associated protein